jgi:hypothetical protein
MAAAETMIEPLEDSESYRAFEAAQKRARAPLGLAVFATPPGNLDRALAGIPQLRARRHRAANLKRGVLESPALSAPTIAPEAVPTCTPTRHATSPSASCGSPTWTARRYETGLWRQLVQTVFALKTLKRRFCACSAGEKLDCLPRLARGQARGGDHR